MDLSESETWSFQEGAVLGRPIAREKAVGEPNASSKSDHRGSPKAERKEWSHNLHVSPATFHHTEAVFSIVREIYGREHDVLVDDLGVNMAIWSIFLNATLIFFISALFAALRISAKTMAKRIQEQKEEDRIVAKSNLLAMNLTSNVSTSSSSVNHPIALKSPGILKASAGQPDARTRRNSKPDAASSSQGRLKDAYLGGLMVEVAEKLAATDKSLES